MSVNFGEGKPLLDAGTTPDAPSSFITPFAPPSSGRSPQNSWFTTAFYMVAQMAGIGVLGIPAATASSGWLGLPLLVLTAVICMITANLLGSIMMRMPQSAIRDYPSVGGAAFGRVGVALTMASQYSTLIGVSVIFLLLSGMFLNGIFCQVPARLFTIIIGAVMIGILILIPVMKEVRFMAYIGVLTTFIATWFAIGLSVVYYMNGPCYNSVPLVDQVCTTCQHDPALLTIASGFSVYSFAFGGHSSIPNFFLEMKHPRHFYRTSALVFMSALLLLYLPMGLVGYLAYGRGLDQATGTILDAISFYDRSSGTRGSVVAINVILIVHLLAALPIIMTPVCLFFQRAFIKNKQLRMSRSLPMILIRVIVVSVLVLIAVVIPYFLPLVSIVTDISVVFSVYIFPAVFYWKLRINWKRNGCFMTIMQCVGLTLIILYGLLGSAFGLREAIPGLIQAVEFGGNPFANLFTFGCAVANNTAQPPFADVVCVLNNTFSNALF